MSIVKHSFVGFITNNLLLILSIASSIVISRWLGPTQRGVYILFITINTFLSSLSNLGIGLSNTVYLGSKEISLSEINSISIVFSVVITLAIVLLYSFFSEPLNSSFLKAVDVNYVYIALLTLPFSLYDVYWRAMMVGLNEIILLNKTIFAVSLLKVTLDFIVLLIFNLGLNGLVFSFMFSKFFGIVIMLYLTNKKEKIRLRISSLALMKVLNFGLRGYFGGVATRLWQRLDLFILNYFKGADAVGIYSLAASLSEKLWTLLNPIQSAVYPRITNASNEEAINLTTRTTRHVVLLMSIIAIIVFFFSDFLINLLYGRDYMAASSALKLLLPGIVAIGISLIVAVYFIGQLKKPGLLSILAWINVFVNIGLCLVLIPRYGIKGTACASTLTYILGTIIVLVLMKKNMGTTYRNILMIKKEDFTDYNNLFNKLKAKMGLSVGG